MAACPIDNFIFVIIHKLTRNTKLCVDISFQFLPPDTLRLLLTDPKQVELTPYNGLPHLLAPVLTDLGAIPEALNQAVLAMEHRCKQLSDSGVRNIEDYNAKCAAESRLPYIVLVLDEFGDVMTAGYKDEVEQHIARLAAKARAAGIHLVLATQRPSVDVVTGLIKANFPARIAFAVTSQVDSRVILDQPGAETLLGRGDMLWLAPDKPHIERLQGAFVSDEEVEQLVAFWQAQSDPAAPPGVSLESRPAVTDDEDADLKRKAISIAREQGYLSTSLLQRKLRIGYNRAARLVEALEADGVLAREGRRWVLW
ncbi:MAG: DNA translocase SpoIIIE [Anaerolineae bacterium]|nr:DNA translocase SpoIIIE [Anaerolineae bacterium]